MSIGESVMNYCVSVFILHDSQWSDNRFLSPKALIIVLLQSLYKFTYQRDYLM